MNNKSAREMAKSCEVRPRDDKFCFANGALSRVLLRDYVSVLRPLSSPLSRHLSAAVRDLLSLDRFALRHTASHERTLLYLITRMQVKDRDCLLCSSFVDKHNFE